MEDIYDNLDNYNEVHEVQELRKQNMELQLKLIDCTTSMEKLQKNILQDFDNISSEYKKLEVNYSSLLLTARAEIERKTLIISNLNKEKDMLVVQMLTEKERRPSKFMRGTGNSKPKEEALDDISLPDADKYVETERLIGKQNTESWNKHKPDEARIHNRQTKDVTSGDDKSSKSKSIDADHKKNELSSATEKKYCFNEGIDARRNTKPETEKTKNTKYDKSYKKEEKVTVQSQHCKRSAFGDSKSDWYKNKSPMNRERHSPSRDYLRYKRSKKDDNDDFQRHRVLDSPPVDYFNKNRYRAHYDNDEKRTSEIDFRKREKYDKRKQKRNSPDQRDSKKYKTGSHHSESIVNTNEENELLKKRLEIMKELGEFKDTIVPKPADSDPKKDSDKTTVVEDEVYDIHLDNPRKNVTCSIESRDVKLKNLESTKDKTLADLCKPPIESNEPLPHSDKLNISIESGEIVLDGTDKCGKKNTKKSAKKITKLSQSSDLANTSYLNINKQKTCVNDIKTIGNQSDLKISSKEYSNINIQSRDCNKPTKDVEKDNKLESKKPKRNHKLEKKLCSSTPKNIVECDLELSDEEVVPNKDKKSRSKKESSKPPISKENEKSKTNIKKSSTPSTASLDTSINVVMKETESSVGKEKKVDNDSSIKHGIKDISADSCSLITPEDLEIVTPSKYPVLEHNPIYDILEQNTISDVLRLQNENLKIPVFNLDDAKNVQCHLTKESEFSHKTNTSSNKKSPIDIVNEGLVISNVSLENVKDGVQTVIISTGVQTKLEDDASIKSDFIKPLDINKVLATSTPCKSATVETSDTTPYKSDPDNEQSKPSLRIVLKRRRKIRQ